MRVDFTQSVFADQDVNGAMDEGFQHPNRLEATQSELEQPTSLMPRSCDAEGFRR